MDVICQAKSGMGKTAVFVLAVLQQLEPVPGEIGAVILCHTRELAYQICHEFDRFAAYLPAVNVSVIFGGVNIKQQREQLKEKPPSIIVATPAAARRWPPPATSRSSSAVISSSTSAIRCSSSSTCARTCRRSSR